MGIYRYTGHNANILKMINYVAYISNTFFSHFGQAPYPKFALISMANDIHLQKQFHPKRFNMLIDCVSLYALYTACTIKRLLLTFPCNCHLKYCLLELDLE